MRGSSTTLLRSALLALGFGAMVSPAKAGNDAFAEVGLWAWVDRFDGQGWEPRGPGVQPTAEPGRVWDPEVLERADDALGLDALDPDDFDIPLVVNDRVIWWLEHYTSNGRGHFERWLARSSRFRPLIEGELERRELPKDLFYLAMIESGFSPRAYSHAGASGLWQFMPATARDWGLRVDNAVDQRRDPVLATRAGLRYLSRLYDRFGDWHLAYAAYNTGQGRVSRAMSRTGIDDYWELAEQGHLHRDTVNFVPQILAATIIAKDPERYGFTDISYKAPLTYDVVQAEAGASLDALAKSAGTTVAELRALNPALRARRVPSGGYPLRIPEGRAASFAQAWAELRAEQAQATGTHRVVRGDTLSAIARHHDVSVQQLQEWNGISDPRRLRVGQELKIRVPEPAWREYVVQPGDHLTGIARRHGCSVDDLRSWNGLRSTVIQPGQTLRIRR